MSSLFNFLGSGQTADCKVPAVFFLAISKIPAGPVADEELADLWPLLLAGGVEGRVAVPVRPVHHQAVLPQQQSHHATVPGPGDSEDISGCWEGRFQ